MRVPRALTLLLQRAQPVQILIRAAGPVIDRKINRAIAEALEDLPQPPHPGGALAADMVKVDLDREHVFLTHGLVDDRCGRVHDARPAIAARTQTVDTKDLTLKLRCCRAGNGNLGIAVGGAGQDRQQQHFDAAAMTAMLEGLGFDVVM